MEAVEPHRLTRHSGSQHRHTVGAIPLWESCDVILERMVRGNLVGEEESFHIGILAIDALHHGLVAKAVHHSFVYHSIGGRVLRFAFRHVGQDIVTEIEVLAKEDFEVFQLWVCPP